jgi:pyruvate dehydrogenase E1 component
MAEIFSQWMNDPAIDRDEIQDWLDSLADIKARYGAERAGAILALLQQTAYREGIHMPFTANTPYVNTIPLEEQPAFPGP